MARDDRGGQHAARRYRERPDATRSTRHRRLREVAGATGRAAGAAVLRQAGGAGRLTGAVGAWRDRPATHAVSGRIPVPFA
ncbi:hypothetical protein F01_170015 [Burkholderia cenocepacia]|nr:hypothetical protein F01_170015 [Burkholderia cenocepacia]